MTDEDSVQIGDCIDRYRAGDRKAADELFRTVGQQLERVAGRMLRTFPSVRSHTDPADVVQGASMRLLNALRDMRPENSRHFFNLAATQMRRELIDLARTITIRPGCVDRVEFTGREVPDGHPAAEDLDLWTRFHAAVERLPVEEREAIGLLFYHGYSRSEAAAIFGVNERTISRWWQSGCERLKEQLGGDLPIA
jgi:RNA polymerase sigma-70 factor (ECF subfamily)